MNYSSFWANIPELINIQFESVFTYYTGAFRNLDIYLNKGFYSINGYTIARATFGGLDEIISLPLGFIGITYIF